MTAWSFAGSLWKTALSMAAIIGGLLACATVAFSLWVWIMVLIAAVRQRRSWPGPAMITTTGWNEAERASLRGEVESLRRELDKARERIGTETVREHERMCPAIGAWDVAGACTCSYSEVTRCRACGSRIPVGLLPEHPLKAPTEAPRCGFISFERRCNLPPGHGGDHRFSPTEAG